MLSPNRLAPLDQPICTDTWREKYQYKGEADYAATCVRVVNALLAEETPEVRAEALRAMRAREIVPAGRILAGAGTQKRVTLINCFTAPYIQDSMATHQDRPGAGIMDAMSKSAYSLQMGGGIGMDFSTIRPRGAVVKRTASVSSGVLPFMDMWHAMSSTIMSAGHRRGAMMGTLGIWHPDIEEFIEAKQVPGRLTNFNVSVLVPDEFMRAVEKDEEWDLHFPVPRADGRCGWSDQGGSGRLRDLEPPSYVYKIVRARELWDKIINATYIYAEPGVVFIDRVNQLNNLAYCEHIHALNPCFPGDTLVWTAYGPRRFDDLARAGKSIPVLTQLADGRLVYRDMTNPRRTRCNADLLEITLESHSHRGKRTKTKIRCTPNHELFLVDGARRRADQLRSGDRVASVYRRKANSVRAALRGSREFVLEHWVACEYQNGRRPDYPREHAHHKDDNKANNRPDNIEILPGAEHDGLKMRGDLNPMRRFPEKNPFSRPGFSVGENNGRYRDDIDDAAITAMRESGLTFKAIAAELGCNQWTVRKRLGLSNHRVVSVRALRVKADVYCGTVKTTGKFFVLSGEGEGVLVSNCGEQMLPDDGCCDLGHTNLAVMVDEPFGDATFKWRTLEQSARLMVRLLDRVLDVTQWPTERQAEEARQKRRIGLGFTGLASALQQLGIPYGSEEAIAFTTRVARAQAVAAYEESVQLAKERGAFPMFEADHYVQRPFVQKLPKNLIQEIETFGIRNGVLLSIAPTGTTSLAIGNVSSGIEPVFAHKYRRKVCGGSGELEREYSIFDYGYLKYCETAGMDPDCNWGEMPPGFVTADQLTVEQHLQMAAAAQEWVDSAISKTINCPTLMGIEEFKEVYTRAYALGMKGCTTYRPDPRSGRGSVLEAGTAAHTGAPMKADAGQEVKPRTQDDPHTVAPPSASKIPMQELAEGRRYRIRWPTEDCAYYIFITDYVDATGRRRPFELFVSTKSERHSEWVKAFSLLVTAIFRREGDPTFVVDELRSVFAATGGSWMKVPWQDKPKLATSLVAAIGLKIEEHLRWLGMIEADEAPVSDVQSAPPDGVMPAQEMLDICESCGARAVIYSEGCATCHACGKSDCG